MSYLDLGLLAFAYKEPLDPYCVRLIDECLKHSDSTRVSLSFSCRFGTNYIVFGIRFLI